MKNILTSKLSDYIKKSDHMEVSTKFLNLEEISQSIIYLEKEKVRNYFLYPRDCERQIIHFYPDYVQEGQYDLPICAVKITYSKRVSHRDVLGSLMGLNIKREFIGDILIFENYCYVYVLDSMLDFISMNLVKVSNQNVSVSQVEISEIESVEIEFKLIKDTVKTLRFDSLVSSGFKISRNDAVILIKAGKVFLNSKEIIKPDYKVNQGDKISIKGKGKMELFDIGGTSKKDRIFIEIKKYI